jgi:hypothetical protein
LPTQGSRDGQPIRRIVVRVAVGNDRMGGTDDPVYLRLSGPAGREFRLKLARGRSFQRGKVSSLVLGGSEDSETNIAHPELNDPSRPALAIGEVERVLLVKGMEPIPNVRGVGELDDRLLIDSAEVSIEPDDGGEPRSFRRDGPFWLGMVSGMSLELARVGTDHTEQ